MIEEFKPGDTVKVIRAITCSAESYIGKTGVIIRQGGGFMISHHFVKIDNSDKEQAFYDQELQKIV